MFDADTKCEEKQKENNQKQNKLLLNLLQLEDFDDWPSKNIYSDRAIIWSGNIQDAILADFPEWLDQVKATCTAWGWDYKRLDKNPAVLAYTLNQALQNGASINSLNEMADKIMSFVSA